MMAEMKGSGYLRRRSHSKEITPRLAKTMLDGSGRAMIYTLPVGHVVPVPLMAGAEKGLVLGVN